MNGVPQSLSQSVSELLARWEAGDKEAFNALIPMLYGELHRLAHHYLQGERSDHTLQTTALVNEAYLRLAKQGPFHMEDRGQFVALAARVMRQVLVDYARAHRAQKRGAEYKVELTEEIENPAKREIDVMALDHALRALSQRDAQQSLIVELRFFGGLTLEETAAVLGISLATTKRDWSMAKAWLSREIKRGTDGESAAVEQD